MASLSTIHVCFLNCSPFPSPELLFPVPPLTFAILFVFVAALQEVAGTIQALGALIPGHRDLFALSPKESGDRGLYLVVR